MNIKLIKIKSRLELKQCQNSSSLNRAVHSDAIEIKFKDNFIDNYFDKDCFAWLYQNISHIKKEHQKVRYVFISIKLKQLHKFKFEIIVLKQRLKDFNICLSVNIFNCHDELTKNNIRLIYELKDCGVVLSINEKYIDIPCINIFDFIQVEFEKYLTLKDDDWFNKNVLTSKKEIIVNAIEDNLDSILMEPIDLVRTNEEVEL